MGLENCLRILLDAPFLLRAGVTYDPGHRDPELESLGRRRHALSKFVTVDFRGRAFWAYDVSLSILLAYVASYPKLVEMASYSETWHRRRERVMFIAAQGDAIDLDTDWHAGEDEAGVLEDAIRWANQRITERVQFTDDDAEQLVDANAPRYTWRWDGELESEVIVSLGTAVIDLINGRLAEPPPGTWWYFGAADHPLEIPMRDGAG